MNESIKIKKALAGLKDFQLKTVDYVFEQMYHNNKHKILVADEVGLGKTLVAKGIIAKAYENYLNSGGPTKENPVFNVVYICSNLSLAAQNMDRLNLMEDDRYVDDIITRLNYFAYQPPKEERTFLINALTPGTSFNEGSRQGTKNERAIIYNLMWNYEVFRKRENGLKWILKGAIREMATWESAIREHEYSKIRPDLSAKFRDRLFRTEINDKVFPRLSEALNTKTRLSLWEGMKRVCERIDGRNAHTFNFQNEIITNLRNILSQICLEYLNADIFILDEFQKFSDLIKLDEETESPAVRLAREIFRIEGAKVLMLSATPFKPYTNDFDELNGEVHYKDFQTVLKFLMSDKDEDFWVLHNHDRKKLFSILRHPKEPGLVSENAKNLKESIERTYREVMVRTERLLVSEDSTNMLQSVLKDRPLKISPEDIEDFVNLDRVTQHLNEAYNFRLPVPLEYVKSTPFTFSFMEGYNHKRKLEDKIADDEKLIELVKKTKSSWINIRKINEYKPLLDPENKRLPNAKLRLLLDQTVNNGGWKYLWIPPSVPYYDFEGAYKNSDKYSKTLIFSSWKMVPRMISCLVSYEAERLSVGMPESITARDKLEEQRHYFAKKRSPYPQFTFKLEKEDGSAKQMIAMAYILPFPRLAAVYDPMRNLVSRKMKDDILSEIKQKLRGELTHLTKKYGTSEGSDWQKWYWAAPLLLERVTTSGSSFSDWILKGYYDAKLLVDSEDDSPQEDESNGKKKHFAYAAEVFANPETLPLPGVNNEQLESILEFLGRLCLGSPGIAALRSLGRYVQPGADLLNAAFNIAEGFVTLFNKPESIAVVRLTTGEGSYVNRVLEYSADGNIQSMLDEYIYLLSAGGGISNALKISTQISDMLSIRTSAVQVDDLNTFLNKHVGRNDLPSKKMRSHFAVDFGNQRVNTATAGQRQINIREAFNSPFRPFILASTSIGQEGLDFHYYCKKIFHWNLPANPIDLEQREGRIHRYKGLVIRQNIADKYLPEITDNGYGNIWDALFSIAAEEKLSAKTICDLVPFWHTETKNNLCIERFVPLYPFSTDLERYRHILKVLAVYRLTFGQPRQEELIEALAEGNADFADSIKELMINLSPLIFLSDKGTEI